MKPLNVLILITKANWGGAQRFVYDLATGLPKDAFSVEVMTGAEGPLTAKLLAAGIPASGTLELGRDVSVAKDAKGFFRLVSLLRKKKPDVLHVNSSKIGGLGALAGRLAGVPKITFTVHGWAFNEERPWYQKAFIKFLYWFTILLTHETMVVSQASRKQAEHWPFIQGKMILVHNGIKADTGYSRPNARLELVRMDPRLKAATDGIPESKLVWVGTIAELHHVKGYDYAIRAIAECVDFLRRMKSPKKVIYTIMGDGEDRDRLPDLIKKLHLEEHVFLLGRVESAAQYIKAFDIFMLASISEGLPYVLLEAGTAGATVVATAVGGLPEIVNDMSSGILVQPRNARDLAHALSYVTEHPKEAREYGSKLKEKIATDFSMQKMLAEIQNVYLRPRQQ